MQEPFWAWGEDNACAWLPCAENKPLFSKRGKQGSNSSFLGQRDFNTIMSMTSFPKSLSESSWTVFISNSIIDGKKV